jgi:hypothetical protein
MHAEFLVRHHVPVDQIIALLVLDPERAREMETLVQSEGLAIKVVVDDKCKWFFP